MANTHESYEYPVGDRLRFFREQKQISTNKLANLAGISQSYVRDIEMGNKNPTIEVLFQLCKALDISLRDFFDDDNKVLLNDPLSTKIYRLNSVQREALLAFLNTIDQAITTKNTAPYRYLPLIYIVLCFNFIFNIFPAYRRLKKHHLHFEKTPINRHKVIKLQKITSFYIHL